MSVWMAARPPSSGSRTSRDGARSRSRSLPPRRRQTAFEPLLVMPRSAAHDTWSSAATPCIGASQGVIGVQTVCYGGGLNCVCCLHDFVQFPVFEPLAVTLGVQGRYLAITGQNDT